MTPRILRSSGSLIVILQVYLRGGPVMTRQIYVLLGGPITVPRISLPQEGPATAPLTQLNLEGLLAPRTHRSSGEPVVTLPVWLLKNLIRCPETRAAKPQEGPLAEPVHIGRGQGALLRPCPRTANVTTTWVSLLHGKHKPSPILEVSSLILKGLPPAIGHFI